MILRKTITIPPVPPRDEVRDYATECDICHKRVTYRHPNQYDGYVEWEADSYHDESKTAVYVERKTNGYDYGDVDRKEYHICPQCFEDVLIPCLESHGAQPNVVKYDW